MSGHNVPVTVYVSKPLGSLDLSALELGGPGSGNWAHAGRPGLIGGSQPRNSGMSIKSGKDWLERYRKAAGKEHPEAEKLREAFGKEKAPTRPAITPFALSETKGDLVKNWGPDEYNASARVLFNIRNTKNYVDSHNCYNDMVRASVKDDLVTEISERTGVDYEIVNKMVKQWSYTSNDHNYQALCLQEDAAAEFGLELSDWQKQRIAEIKQYGDVPEAKHLLHYDTPDPQGTSRKVLRAMYEFTQEEFKKQGVTEVVIFRGVQPWTGSNFNFERGQKVQWKGNAIESWSGNSITAAQFAGTGGVMLAAKVPVSRILSTCRTGFGCLNEYEYVLMGPENGAATPDIMTIAKPQKSYVF